MAVFQRLPFKNFWTGHSSYDTGKGGGAICGENAVLQKKPRFRQMLPKNTEKHGRHQQKKPDLVEEKPTSRNTGFVDKHFAGITDDGKSVDCDRRRMKAEETGKLTKRARKDGDMAACHAMATCWALPACDDVTVAANRCSVVFVGRTETETFR